MPYLTATGSCCAPCAKSGATCAGLGATKSLGARNVVVSSMASALPQKSTRMLIVGALFGTAALGAFYLARRKR